MKGGLRESAGPIPDRGNLARFQETEHERRSDCAGASHIRAISPYQPGKPISELARELGLDEAGIIKLASNENPLGMSEMARTPRRPSRILPVSLPRRETASR